MRKFVCCATLLLLALSLVACDGDSDSGSAITAITAGTGLSGGGNSGEVTLSADADYLQRRVDDLCMGDTAIKSIDDDGTVTCSSEMSLATHNHDAAYSALGHDHDADYSASDHNHDGVYAPAAHNHDAAYAAAAHDHDARYFSKASFTGHSTNNCTNDTGFFIIGNVQEEFGCHESCDTICQRHGLTCSRVRHHDGAMGSCSAVLNSAVQYCWCIS